ncbi:hypothetical protein [Staphylococcus debuckii]|uniref:DUF1657 domain-containing protein n=1 Tax=Staphylococcus debuckii TaxID=2044912 RepID=A0ABU9EUB0_9STAP
MKKVKLQNLIFKANSLLTESHFSMNQDEAQLKKTVEQAQTVLKQAQPDYELVKAISTVQQGIHNVEQYKAFVNYRQ